jgi:uncharacterized protein (TIGR03435 family)
MVRRLLSVSLVALLASPVFGQSPATPPPATPPPATLPGFEIADVRVSAPRMNPGAGVRPGAVRNGVYEIANGTMLDLIRIAYMVEADKVLGGPSWLEVDRFDVVARVPASTTMDTARPMLQALLADRFKLVVREEKKEMNTWVLSEASPGSAKLLRSQGGIAPSCQGQPEPPNVKGICRNQSMIGFLNTLQNVARTYVTGPITNATGLTGSWDFDIVFTQDRAQLKELGAQGISLFDALEKQLGLKLEQKTITALAFNVDSVNRTPTANVPGIEKILPPPPAPEFEVAELKPTAPGNTQQRAQVLPSGQINASAMPLRGLINLAWGVNGNDLVAGPKWIDTERFDIIGKAFSGADAQFVDDEFLRQALRKLLVDRFQITFHYEERPVNAYALVARTVKMTKADPSSRTRCYNGVPPGAKDPRQAIASRGGLLTCQNATMTYFAERLRGVAGGYIQAPIAEMTGLEGGWDFTLNWSPIGMFPGGVDGIGGRAGGDGAVGAAPAVPTGAITLPEAVESQLGLKLDMGKRPVRVLVIDQISEQPTGN